jgi:hypothetical protein
MNKNWILVLEATQKSFKHLALQCDASETPRSLKKMLLLQPLQLYSSVICAGTSTLNMDGPAYE